MMDRTRGPLAIAALSMGLLCGVTALAPAAHAEAAPGSRAALREQVETSMLATGELQLDAEGRVTAMELEDEQTLGPQLAAFMRERIGSWEFEPMLVNGVAVASRVPMSVRLVAKANNQGGYSVRIVSADFTDHTDDDLTQVRSLSMDPPSFPPAAIEAGISGTVYLLLRIGRDGRVEDAVAEQVNLRMLAREGKMQRARNLLARVSTAKARHWTFRPPTQGSDVDRPYWSIRVPVSYTFGDSLDDVRGSGWVSYVPGPRTPAPWRTDDTEAEAFSPDALSEGGVYMADRRGRRLLTPLGG